jgi:hypothetical protein
MRLAGLSAHLEFFRQQLQEKNNTVLEEFFQYMDMISEPLSEVQLAQPVNISELISPSASGSFYRYDGSLTNPGCFEVVTWTVFEQPIMISPKQVLYENLIEYLSIYSFCEHSKTLKTLLQIGNYYGQKVGMIFPYFWLLEYLRPLKSST